MIGIGRPAPTRLAFAHPPTYIYAMTTRAKKDVGSEPDLWPEIVAALSQDDGAAAKEHLAAGFPIYYGEADTPEDAIIKEYPDGRRELVRFGKDRKHRA